MITTNWNEMTIEELSVFTKSMGVSLILSNGIIEGVKEETTNE
jgi:hypothetical protein